MDAEPVMVSCFFLTSSSPPSLIYTQLPLNSVGLVRGTNPLQSKIHI